MNLFVLDSDPALAARMACDKHVVKMTLETAQLVCAAFPKGKAPYGPTHVNHPCAVWVRTAPANYAWTIAHGLALAAEYTRRFGKTHASESVLRSMASQGVLVPFLCEQRGLTTFAQAMPEELRGDDPVAAYRRYYLRDKARIATWSHPARPPSWWTRTTLFHRRETARSLWRTQ